MRYPTPNIKSSRIKKNKEKLKMMRIIMNIPYLKDMHFHLK